MDFSRENPKLKVISESPEDTKTTSALYLYSRKVVLCYIIIL